MELKSLIPSIAGRVSRLRPVRPLTQYQSYESALRDSDTYEDPRIIEVVSRKTKIYRDSLRAATGKTVGSPQTLQNLFVLSYVEPARPLAVLELGGACGASYFEINALLPGRIKSWSIVETRGMAAAGRELFAEDGINFFDDLDEAARKTASFDLIVAQGSLQYTSDPLRTLDHLLALRAGYIYASRLALRVDADDERDGVVFTKQVTDLAAHGPGELPAGLKNARTTQPLVLVPRRAIASRLSPPVSLLFWFDESDESPCPVGSKTIITKEVGFLARHEAT